MKIETVGLLGCGRFGRMIHEHLGRDKSLRVFDCDAAKLRGVKAAATFEEAIAAPLIILAVPISAVEQTCRQMAARLRPGQIVVDTCSVKEKPVQWMVEHLPEAVQILGTHPLFGPDSGKAGLAGLKIALCPVRVEPQSYELIQGYLRRLQLVLIEVTPQEHDEQIARTQAIFHLIAQALKRLTWGGQVISTPGPDEFYRLVETVQHDTKQLFLDMERENPFAAGYREEFIRTMVRLHQELSRNRRPGSLAPP